METKYFQQIVDENKVVFLVYKPFTKRYERCKYLSGSLIFHTVLREKIHLIYKKNQ